MNKGKLSIFHPNVAVTKQSQLYFVLYISHILHSESVAVISLHQNVREKRGERVCLSGRHGLLQLTYYFKSNVHARLLDLGRTIHYS